MSRISIEVTPEQHKAIKAMAILEDMAIKDFVWEALEEKLREHRRLAKHKNTGPGHDDCPLCKALGPNRRYNKKTQKAMDDAMKGKGVKRFSSFEELMADLKN